LTTLKCIRVGKPLPKLAGCIAENLILVNIKLLLRVPNLVFLAGRRLTYGIIDAARGGVGLDFATILSEGEMLF